MATTIAHVSEGRMSAGRVFERAFATIRHNPIVTLGLVFIFGAIPGVLTTYILGLAQRDATDGVTPGLSAGFWALTILSMIFGFFISAFVQGILTRATIAEGEGRKATFGECAKAALPVALPLVGLSIILAIGVGLGLILLIVPGVMLYLAWSVAAPVLVDRQCGIFEALKRSAELTKGARWKIFGIMMILTIVYYLFLLAAAAIGFPEGELTGSDLTTTGFPIRFFLVNLAMGLVASTFWGTVQASLYVEVRDWKDGPASANLEEIFR